MARDAYSTLLEEIQAQRAAKVDAMATGGCKDYAHYRELVGSIATLSEMERDIKDLQRNQMERD